MIGADPHKREHTAVGADCATGELRVWRLLQPPENLSPTVDVTPQFAGVT